MTASKDLIRLAEKLEKTAHNVPEVEPSTTVYEVIAELKTLASSEETTLEKLKAQTRKETREWTKQAIKIYADSIKLDHEDSDTYVCPVLDQISKLKFDMLHSFSPADDEGQEEIEESIIQELKAEEITATESRPILENLES